MDGEKEENSVIKMVQAQKEVTQVVFRETKAGLHIAKTEANHQDSMSILAANGLRPLTYQEALSRAPKLIKELEREWFYLAGNGITEDGVYTFNDKGELQPLKGNEKYDQRVSVYPGNQPLSLIVDYDYGDRRFVLYADGGPLDVASVVVGVKAQAPSSSKVLDVVESELGELKGAQREKIERAEKLETEAKQLRQEATTLTKEIEKRQKVAELLRS